MVAEMRYEIEPYVGIGDLHLDERREVIIGILGVPPKRFKRNQRDTAWIDYYNNFGFQFHYDTYDHLEFIETFPPCKTEFRSIRFFDQDINQVLVTLAYLGHTPRSHHGILIFESIGISLYTPSDIIESVSIYRRGYYGILSS
jgi:hypothetical protein